jgi:hypothetical protein
MSIISAVADYLKTYTGLETGAPVWVDYLGADPTQYAIIPLPGAKIVESYLNGGSVREFPFAFQSTESTADDAERLDTQGFYEALSDWFETQSNAGTLPTLGTKKTATKIEALGWGMLEEQGPSDTATYLIQAKLTYEQAP